MPRVDWAAMGLHPRAAHPSKLVLNHPPVGDQGREGSCTAWALGYCAVGVLGYERFKDDWEKQGRSPSFIFNATQAKRALLPSLQRRHLPRASNELRGRKWGLLPRANAIQ